MKNYVLIVCCVCFVLVCGSVNARENNKNIDVSIGFQTYHHEYKEPGLMENEGFFYGLSYSFMYDQNDILFGIEGMLA
ncbi:MAG: hypothetical protein KKE62_04015 [Proteobacteria bacterium]|nr:hypothetical protein [Pseudomonadota bacterium]MBU1387925.1 hypothetical protein [Pseudomonadota bacterium]MBU1541988.1 hypothetical protein [Pseudomonadota bacterium]MBU2431317.1 hypothetical protein [Pseudomonadota bacterium]MBU2481352.1 hypothetical protein [Pseudomonadota bacterium]